MKRLSGVVVLVCTSVAVAPSASAHHSPYLGIVATWGSQGMAPGEFSDSIQALATGPDGSVYALEAPGVVTRFDGNGNLLGRWGGTPTDPDLSPPHDIAVGASGAVYVTVGGDSDSAGKVVKFSPTGALLAEWDGTNGTPAFSNPAGITTDSAGNVYISVGNGEDEAGIVRVTEAGTSAQKLGMLGFLYLARDSDGFFYGPAGGLVQRFSPEGSPVGSIGFSPTSTELGHFDNQFGPDGVAVAADDSIWVADKPTNRVQRFSRDGALLDVCGSPGSAALDFPTDAAPSGDFVVVADGVHIRRVGMVTHPATPCDAVPPKLTDIELLIKGGPRKWFKRSAVQFETSKPAHATLKLQQRVRRHNRRRWRGLDRGRADLQAGQNTIDFSDILAVKPKPRAGRYRIKLRLDDEADNLSRLRKRKFRVR
jgi:DNA-binding beta-propeller fold protein YncE